MSASQQSIQEAAADQLLQAAQLLQQAHDAQKAQEVQNALKAQEAQAPSAEKAQETQAPNAEKAQESQVLNTDKPLRPEFREDFDARLTQIAQAYKELRRKKDTQKDISTDPKDKLEAEPSQSQNREAFEADWKRRQKELDESLARMKAQNEETLRRFEQNTAKLLNNRVTSIPSQYIAIHGQADPFKLRGNRRV